MDAVKPMNVLLAPMVNWRALAMLTMCAVLPGSGAIAAVKSAGFDLSLHQARSGECVAGKTCEYLVTVTNQGKERFVGPLNLLRTASYRPAKHESVEGVNCSRKRDSIACRTASLDLESGQSYSFKLTVTLPRNAGGDIRNCTALSFRGGEFEDPFQDLVAIVQVALQARGLYQNSPIDGKPGKKFIAALSAFRKQHDLPKGEFDAELLKTLFAPSGMMVEDLDTSNHQVCAEYELPKAAVAANRRRRRAVPVVRAQRRTSPGSFTSTDTGGRRTNLRLDGLELEGGN